MPRRRKLALFSLIILLSLSLLLLSTFRSAPLPPPAPLLTDLPPASPPAGMSLHHLPTGVTHRSAAFAYRGGAFADPRDFTMSAALIKHPKGDVLIDTGFGRDIDRHFALMPFYFRAVTSYQKATPAADQLAAAHYPRHRLHAILLTHAHWDHVSGLADFPGTPVLVTAEERAFIDSPNPLATVARSIPDINYKLYTFDGPPYLGFPASHDLHGDGSIVIVPAPGHTPGSVIVFVALPTGRRHAFLGDLAWQHEGVEHREERPWLQRTLADVDPVELRTNLLRMSAILAAFPDLHLLPAHDARAYAALPPL